MTKEHTFSRSHDIEAIALIGASHASSHFYHLVIPSLLPWLMPCFGLNYTQSGVIVTAFFVVSAFGQALAGILVDKLGARGVLTFGLACLATSSVLLGCSMGLGTLTLASAIAGLGNSVYHPVDFSLINYNVSPARLGHAYAWHQILGNVGWALCPVMMVGIASLYSWRTAAFCAASMSLLILTVTLLRRKTIGRDQSNDEGDDSETAVASPKTLTFLTIPAVWLCFAFFLFTTMGFSCMQNFAPSIFRHTYGLTVGEASLALTTYLILSGIGSFVGGYLVGQKRVSLDFVVALCIGSAAVMAVLLASQCLPGGAVAFLMGAMGFGVGMGGPSRDALIRGATLKKLNRRATGRVYGFVYCGMDFGQFVAPLIFGQLMDACHFSEALYLVALFQTLAILTVIQVGKKAGVRSRVSPEDDTALA